MQEKEKSEREYKIVSNKLETAHNRVKDLEEKGALFLLFDMPASKSQEEIKALQLREAGLEHSSKVQAEKIAQVEQQLRDVQVTVNTSGDSPDQAH